MFALPGICALIFLMLARPQEYFEVLQRLPLLYLFCGAALGGFAIDLRLRRLQPLVAPTLPWVIAFLLWIVICDAKAGTSLVPHLIEVGIIMTLYVTVAHGVQRFRAFHVVPTLERMERRRRRRRRWNAARAWHGTWFSVGASRPTRPTTIQPTENAP